MAISKKKARKNIEKALSKVRAARGGVTGSLSKGASVKGFRSSGGSSGGSSNSIIKSKGFSSLPRSVQERELAKAGMITSRQDIQKALFRRQATRKQKQVFQRANEAQKQKILNKVIQKTPVQAGLDTIASGRRSPFGIRIVNKFERILDKRRKEAARVSREISRKVQEGKRLTVSEKRARTAAGLQNVGIEALAGFTFLPRAGTRLILQPKKTIRATKEAISTAIKNPKALYKGIKEEIERNPSGFIAGMIGSTGGFSIAGKATKVVTRVTRTGLKYSAKIGEKIVEGTIKGTSKGIRNTIKVIGKGGRKIVTKSRLLKFVKKGKLPKQLSIKQVSERVKEISRLERNIRNLEKITTGKNIPKKLAEQIKKLKDRSASLKEGLGLKGQRAASLKKISIAEKQAKALKKALEKSTKIKKKINLEKLKKARLLKKAVKKAARRKKVKQRRIAKKQAGKIGRKQIRKPFQRRNIRERLQLIKKEAENAARKRGQTTLKDISEKIRINNKINDLRLKAVELEARQSKNIRNFFNRIDRQIGKAIKKRKGGGCK